MTTAAALLMTDEEAAHILTMLDEPELLHEPGETPPVFTDEEIQAARLRGKWMLKLHETV